MTEKVQFVDIIRPLSEVELEEQLEEELGGQDGEHDPVSAGEAVARRHTLRLAFVSASRVKSYDRGDARDRAREWLLEELGLDRDRADEIDWTDLPPSINRVFAALWQAADIVGALVPGQCENWTPPAEENFTEWAEMPDYIFTPALSKAWELNPHWMIETTGAGSEGN